MPRAEVGSTKYLNNKLKSKGLQRLRWYCQVCERQMRDENGFKCHVASESHVRQMLVIGQNPNKVINDYSQQFQKDFLSQLRTAHGTKAVHINHFYQEYIANKEHVHMNATRWPSLTEFAKFLGREGICRVEETDKGVHIAWIDNSPEALRRQEALRRKEMQDKGDEEREQRLIQEQVKRAQDNVKVDDDLDDEARELRRVDGEKIKLNFGSKATATTAKTPTPHSVDDEEDSRNDIKRSISNTSNGNDESSIEEKASGGNVPKEQVKMSFSANSSKPKNVFAVKKNPLAAKKSSFVEPLKKISEAERIMKEEIERKRSREVGGQVGFSMKKQRVL